MNDFFGPYNTKLLGPLFGDKDYSSDPPVPGTGSAMNGYFGPYFDNYFGPLFANMEADPPVPETDLVTITGQTDICDGEGYYSTFLIRQVSGIFNVNGKQIIRKDKYVMPDQITGEWSANLYPSNYYFIFRNGQNIIQETKTVTTSTSYDNLEDYTG